MRDTHFVLESALKKSSPGPSVVGEGGRGTFATWSGSDAASRFLLRENSVDPVLLVGGMYIPDDEALMGLPSAMATCLDIVLGGT